MTPPNDAARPVRWIVDNCLFYDEESANAFSESLLGSPTCNPTVFPVYTAADYDALRAEVEKLQALRKHHRARHKSYKKRFQSEQARAEAVEAKVAAHEAQLHEAQVDLSLTRTNIMIELSHGRDRWEGVPEHLQGRIESISAALNEGGE